MADYPDFDDSFESSSDSEETGPDQHTVVINKGDDDNHPFTHLYLHNLGKHEESYDSSSQTCVLIIIHL